MKKRTVVFFLGSLLAILLLSACGRTSSTSGSVVPPASPVDAASAAAASTETETPSAAPSESAIAEASPAASDQPSATAETPTGSASSEASPGVVFTNEQLTAGMNAVDSYRRISKTTITSEGVDPFVTIHTFSTVRSPFADHYTLEFPPLTSYVEDMVIGDTMYSRIEKEGKWEKYDPGNWQREMPLAFSYKLQAAKYVIDYQKLAYLLVGSETANGRECSHYQVSGTYDGEYEPMPDMEKYPVTITVSGDVWIAESNAADPVLIRQRLLLETDVTGTDGSHTKEETILEDDTLDINATVIEAPVK